MLAALRGNVGRLVFFALMGGVGTAIQYAALGVGTTLLAVPAAISSGAGYILGAFANYGLNYRYTFRCSAAHHTAGGRSNYGLRAFFWRPVVDMLGVWWFSRRTFAQNPYATRPVGLGSHDASQKA